MFVFYDGTKYNLTPLEIIDLVKKGYFSPDTEVEYKGKIHKLSEFKEIRLLFKKTEDSNKETFFDNNKDFEESSIDRKGESLRQPVVDTPQGSEVEDSPRVEKAQRKGIFVYILSCVGIVLIGVGLIALLWGGNGESRHNNSQQKVSLQVIDSSEEQNVEMLYKKTYLIMVLGGGYSELLTGRIHSVWHDAIYEELNIDTFEFTRSEDHKFVNFNVALEKLMSDDSFKDIAVKILENQAKAAEAMKTLNNISNKNQDIHDLFMKQYRVYLKYTRLAIEPSGSLAEYDKNCNEVSAEFSDNMSMLKLYIE